MHKKKATAKAAIGKPKLAKLGGLNKRGQLVDTGGQIGIFIGRSPAGTDWVAYGPSTFNMLCARFDKLYN